MTNTNPIEVFCEDVRARVRRYGLEEDYQGVQTLLQGAMRYANLSVESRTRYLQALDPNQWVDLLPDGRVRLHAQHDKYRILTDSDLIRRFVTPDAIIVNTVGMHFCKNGQRKLVVTNARLGQDLFADSAIENLKRAATLICGTTDRELTWQHLLGRRLVILAYPRTGECWMLQVDHPDTTF